MVRIGAHVSSAGSIDLIFDRAKEIGAATAQFFLRSPRSWAWKERSDKEKENFIKKQNSFNVHPLIVHGSYLFNLASNEENLRKKSIIGVIEELNLCEELNINYYVIHAGKSKGQKEEQALKNVIDALEIIFKKVNLKNTTFLVETLAGQKGEIGKNTQEIKKLITPFETEKIGVCVDTCHIYSAGYKINEEEGFKKFKEEVESTVGIEKVKVIHCNDSKTPFNSHKDRHEHIGEGSIGYKGFEFFLNDKYFSTLPFILETPKQGNMDIVNINRLKKLVKAPVAQSG